MVTGGKAETESPVHDWAGGGPSEPCLWVWGRVCLSWAGFQVSKTMPAEQVTAEDALYLLISYTLHLSISFPETLSHPGHHCTQNTACGCACDVSAISQKFMICAFPLGIQDSSCSLFLLV